MELLQQYFTTAAALGLLGGSVLFGFVYSLYSKLRLLPVPPGPPQSNWLLGHLSILPSKKPWETYLKWAQQYGISSMEHGLRLSSSVELISTRSYLASAGVQSKDYTTVFSGGLRRASRKTLRSLFQQTFIRNGGSLFRKEQALLFRAEQTRKVNDMLHGLLTSPEDFREHVKTLSAAIVMSATYGYDISPKKDYFVEISEAAVLGISLAVLPGATMVNVIPALRHLPTWFPGTTFHRIAAGIRQLTTQLQDVPFNWTREKMAGHSAYDALLTKLTKSHQRNGEETGCIIAHRLPSCTTTDQVVTLKEIAANIYAAGADTTTASMNTFFYIMAAVSPESQLKAQEELDRVVGPNRLPTYEDCDSMPYIEAIVREVLRFSPVFPLGLPHCVTENDVYKGYHIPKGSIVLPNVWAISRNPTKYQEPARFNPDRFLDDDGNLTEDDAGYIFGFGRRVCAGRHMARATLWLAMATTLWAFNIKKAKDASGNEIPISGEFLDAMIRHPLPHACSIVPRSREVERVIKEAVAK